MADISEQELENLIRTLQADSKEQNKTLFNLVASVDKRSAAKELDGALSRRTRKLGDAMDELGGSFDSASRYILRSVGEGGLLGAAIAGMVTKGIALTKTYNELVNSGASFNGSIQEMVTAAADAGMPLDEFAQATIKSSKAMKQMGDKNWPAFQKSFRELAVTNGQYGLSIDQLNDFQAVHLESMRMANSATKGSANDLHELAKQTVAMSDITGVATSEIAQLANTVLQGSGALAVLKTLPTNMRAAAEKNMQQVLAVLASQAGQAGDFMSRAFANTSAMKGFSEFTAEGQDLISVGMGNVAQMFNDLARDPSVSKSVQVNNALYDSIEQNMDMLQAQAMSGNQTAKDMMQMFQNMKRLSVDEINRAKQKATEQEGITKTFNTMRVVWDGIVGAFKSGFSRGIEPLMDSLGHLAENGEPHLKTIEIMMGRLGTGLGNTIGALFMWFTPERIDNIGNFISNFGEGISQINWKSIFTVMGTALSIMGTPLRIIASGFEAMAAHLPKLTGAIIGGVGIFLAFRKLKNLFGNNMIVNASTVVVNGGDGGDGDGMFGDSGGGKGKSSAWRRARAGYRRGGIRGAIRGGAGGLLRSARGLGAGGLLKGGAKLLAPLGAALEASSYLFGDKAFSMKNLAKTGLSWGGGALGAIGGGLMTAGLGGQFAGGAAGYVGGGALANWLFGDDDKKGAKPAGAGRAGLAGVAAGAVGATAVGAMLQEGAKTVKTEGPVVDALNKMNDILNKVLEQVSTNNDLTLSSGRSQTLAMKNQSLLLKQLIEKT